METFITDPQLTLKEKKTIQFKKQQFEQLDEEQEKKPQLRDKEQRNWEQIQQKISFLPEDGKLQDNKPPIKPGYSFYRALLNIDPKKMSDIYINLPTTLIPVESEDFYGLLYTNEQGKLCKKESSWNEFEKIVLEENKALSLRFRKKYEEQKNKERKFNDLMTMKDLVEKISVETNQDTPYICTRTAVGDAIMQNQVSSYRSYKDLDRKSNADQRIEQRFIISRPLRACKLRLVYYTKNSHEMKSNYGYRIINHTFIFDPDIKMPLAVKAILISDKQNSYEIQLVKGLGLMEYERQAQQIVQLIERKYNVRIQRIVLDFIQDIEGKIWFFNCRAISSEITLNMSSYITGSGEDQGQQGKKTLDQLTCSVYCKLCGIKFKKDDASKVLTYKLLWELVQHLKKRNIYLQKIKVSHSSTRPCRVCNLCYMLIVGEHELIEIEQRFAKAQNVPMQDEVIRVPIDIKPKHRPALLSETLNQWRLIFYFQQIVDITPEMVANFKNLHFQYKLHNFRTCFKTTQLSDPKSDTARNQPNPDYQQKNSQNKFPNSLIDNSKNLAESQKKNSDQGQANIYQIRVHYFFSEDKEDHEDLNIEKFLQETEIKVRLTNGEEWGQFIAEGSSKTISHFQNKMAGGQRHSSQVLLFFENSKYCVLTLSAGLVCDGKYNTGKLNLYKYNDVYFPDENYYNCNPFPDEWMEMFDKQYVSQKDQISDTKNNEKYSPKCTKAELNNMIDFNSKSKSKQYHQIQSQVKQYIKINNLSSLQINSPQAIFPQTAKNQKVGGSILPDGIQQLNPQTTKFANQNPQQQQAYQNSLPPRALTATRPKLNRNQSDFNYQPYRPLTSIGKTQQEKQLENQKNYQRSAGSYKFLLDKKNATARQEEKMLQQQYGAEAENEVNFNNNYEDEESSNESTDEILREKLLQHFKQQNKIDQQFQSKPKDKQPHQQNLENNINNDLEIQSVGSQALMEFLNQQKLKYNDENQQQNI